jgi:hypothetical protein
VTSRQIFKGRSRAEREVENLLQSILAAELVAPSQVIWLVSPWVSDVPVLDNQTGGFSGLEPTWARKRIRLVEALTALISKGASITVATRTGDHNERFVHRLDTAIGSMGLGDRLLVRLDEEERLHEKGLLGDDYYLSGSMNFTDNGIRLNDEAVKYELSPEAIAQARVSFRQQYGAPHA